MNIKPVNCGKPWSKEEENKMLESIKKGKTFKDIATEHGRSDLSIDCKTKGIAVNLHLKNTPLNDIIKQTRLGHNEIMEAVTKYNAKNKAATKRATSQQAKNEELMNKINNILSRLDRIETLLAEKNPV